MVIHQEAKGRIWHRLYQTRRTDPLGFARTKSRFSDPTGHAFGLVYLGSSLKVCFAEAVLRDRGDDEFYRFPITWRELEALTCAKIEVAEALRLIDLTGDGPLTMRIPSDVVGARDQTLAQLWSEAFHRHPDAIDGVIYPSRLNEERNIAIYERSLGKLAVKGTSRLVALREELAAIIDKFEIGII
jgi:hypothetical protein